MNGTDQSRVVKMTMDCPACGNTNREMRRHCAHCSKSGRVHIDVAVGESNAILHQQVLKVCRVKGTEGLEQHHWTWLKMNGLQIINTLDNWTIYAPGVRT